MTTVYGLLLGHVFYFVSLACAETVCPSTVLTTWCVYYWVYELPKVLGCGVVPLAVFSCACRGFTYGCLPTVSFYLIRTVTCNWYLKKKKVFGLIHTKNVNTLQDGGDFPIHSVPGHASTIPGG